MRRYTKKDVEVAVAGMARLIGAPLKLEIHSPGDRHGTRYRIYTPGSTPGSLGRRLIAECGAQATCRHLYAATALLEYYKETHQAAYATAQLQDIETQ